MKMFISLKRIMRYGWQDFWRGRSVSFSTVFVTVMMLSVLTSLLFLREAFQVLITRLQQKVDISVYFVEKTGESDILKLKEELTKIPQVKEVEYISRERALQNFIQSHRNNPRLMEALTEVGTNPLPASLNIRASEAVQYAQVSSFLENSAFGELIEKIDYFQRKPVIDRVFTITSAIKTAGSTLALILTFIAASLIFNQIRLAIYQAREEIGIMRSVGASASFVQGPFLVQGILVGVSAAVITLAVFLPVSFFLSPKLGLLLPGLDFFGYFVNNLLSIVLIQFGSGIGLGVISSLVAVRRYLD